MRAIGYHGPDKPAWEGVPEPVVIDDTDGAIRVDAVTRA
jgi:hypothetical protein